MIRDSKQLQIGKAGEYLVCADLILKGFIAFPSEQGLPYDVILDTGNKMLRVQVKTTESARVIPQRGNPIPAYIFSIKRAGANGKTRYDENEIDLFALVCLDTMEIGYILNRDMPTTINIRVDSKKGTYYDEQGIKAYEKCIELSSNGKSQKEISKEVNIAVQTVSKYLSAGWKPFKSNARYFSDFIKDKEWFLAL